MTPRAEDSDALAILLSRLFVERRGREAEAPTQKPTALERGSYAPVPQPRRVLGRFGVFRRIRNSMR